MRSQYWTFTIVFWQINKLWCKCKSRIKILIDWLIYHFTTNIVPYGANRTTSSHFCFLFELVSLQIHSHYTAQDNWPLHFSHHLSLFTTQNHYVMVIRDINFLLCTICELPPPIIPTSTPFWHGKMTKFAHKVLMKCSIWLILGIPTPQKTSPLIGSMS